MTTSLGPMLPIGPMISVDLSPPVMAVPTVAAMIASAGPVLPIDPVTSAGLSPPAMAASPSPP